MKKNPWVYLKKIAEEIEEVKTVFENHTEEKITFTETKIEEEFKFIEKYCYRKVQARRDKLKEFNSRYQTIENEMNSKNSCFLEEKNINIGHENASQQQFSFLVSENNGRVQPEKTSFKQRRRLKF